jgi:hypothetical protein
MDDLFLVGQDKVDFGKDGIERRLVGGLEDPPAEFGADEIAGQSREQVVEKPGNGGIPDDQDDEMNFFAVDGVEIDALARSSDGDGDLAARVDAGMGQGDAVTDGRGFQVFPVDDPGQKDFLVGDEFLFGQNAEKLFDRGDFFPAFELDDLGGFEIVGEPAALV